MGRGGEEGEPSPPVPWLLGAWARPEVGVCDVPMPEWAVPVPGQRGMTAGAAFQLCGDRRAVYRFETSVLLALLGGATLNC